MAANAAVTSGTLGGDSAGPDGSRAGGWAAPGGSAWPDGSGAGAPADSRAARTSPTARPRSEWRSYAAASWARSTPATRATALAIVAQPRPADRASDSAKARPVKKVTASRSASGSTSRRYSAKTRDFSEVRVVAAIRSATWLHRRMGGMVYAPVSYTHLRAHETVLDLVCRLLLE